MGWFRIILCILDLAGSLGSLCVNGGLVDSFAGRKSGYGYA
jgi:hypothetical protein